MEHLGMSYQELQDVTQDVRQRYPDVDFPDVEMTGVFYGMSRADSEVAKDRQAIVTTLKGERRLANICSDQYMLIPHEWAVWRLENILDTSPAFEPLGPARIKPNVLGVGGVKMRLVADFPEADVKIGPDQVNPRAGIKNSLDLSLEWEPWFGGRVKRCTNGLLMWGNLIEGGKKHKLSLDLEENVNRLIAGVEKLDEMFGIWDSWSKKLLSRSEAKKMLEASPLSDRQVENIIKLPEIGTNMTIENEEQVTPWFINSVVTQYIEHEMENTPSRILTEEKVTNYLNEAFQKAA